MWREAVEDILNCTTLATCGHPGGSMSSIHFLLVLYGLANVRPESFQSVERDRVIISHGHISPGTYAALAQFGFFPREEMVLNFRKLGSRYSGHVETGVPGVEWNTGNLGQGISAACGMALAGKLKGLPYKTIVCMGDGEQQKGQISEARRFAVKYKLNNLITIIDYNQYQISGAIHDIMPQDIPDNYRSDGWNVLEIKNGHDFQDIYAILCKAWTNQVEKKDHPTMILAHTKMGYGVSFMGGINDFHGRSCTIEEHAKAFNELGFSNRIEELKEKRKNLPKKSASPNPVLPVKLNLDPGVPILYDVNVFTDNRSAFGAALADLAKINNFSPEKTKIVGISCDLEGSVKMNAFKKTDPKHFFESGIQEHHACVMAGSLSKEGYQVFFSTFGMFGIDEVYNQQRLNAFNNANLKTVCTHLGLNVGEDGATHHCIDYIGLLRNIYHYSVFIPADPNQTDRVIRYVALHYGNFFVGMGRAKTPVITNNEGKAFFGNEYTFIPGKADILRNGTDLTVITMGPLVEPVLKAADQLAEEKKMNVRVLNWCSVIPFDREALIDAARMTRAILTVEDHHVETGVGNMVAKVMAEERLCCYLMHLGVSCFNCSGSTENLYRENHLDKDSIKEKMLLIHSMKTQEKPS